MRGEAALQEAVQQFVFKHISAMYEGEVAGVLCILC